MPSTIIDFPVAIFRTRNDLRAWGALRHAIVSARATETEIPEKAFRRLAWYPTVLAPLIAEGELTPEEAAPLLQDPVVGFRVLREKWGELVQWLEPQLLASAEAAEMILAYRRKMAGGPTQLDEIYIDCMADDPNRLLRSLAFGGKPDPRISKIIAESEGRRNESAAWAFCFLNAHPTDPLTSEMEKALVEDDEYAYRAAALLEERGQPNTLVRGIKSPRWLFHVLRDGLAGDHKSVLEERLMASPPWMVEYWQTTKMELPLLQQQCRALISHAEDHPCFEDLDPWFVERATHLLIHGPRPAATAR